MDRQVIDHKLESLRRCLSRIESKMPFDAAQLAGDFDLQDIVSLNLTRAVHNYSTINWQVVNAIVLHHLQDFKNFAVAVTHWQAD